MRQPSGFLQLLLASSAVVLLAGCSQAVQNAQTPLALTTTAQRSGYAVGYRYGGLVAALGVNVDETAAEAGFHDRLSGAPAKVNTKDRKTLLAGLKKRVEGQQKVAAAKQAARQNLAESRRFLAKIAKRQDVTTTPSGLEYRVVRKGTGKSPTKNDVVTIAYRAILPNGKVFGGTSKKTGALKIPATHGSPGFVEALSLMQQGGISVFYMPAKLAFGTRGLANRVGPNQAVVYEVQLLKVAPASARH